MYSYQLINNHYIAEIDGLRYLIDTGCGWSLSIVPHIVIDGKRFNARRFESNIQINAAKFIGAEIDGIIGLDVLACTSLTIYKGGKMDFAKSLIDGNACPFVFPNGFPVAIPAIIGNDEETVAIIDTGASYYYGDYSRHFKRENYVADLTDYNPQLGWFRAKFYEQKINVGGRSVGVTLGDCDKVTKAMHNYNGVAMFINVTELFDEVLVFDFENRKLIIR